MHYPYVPTFHINPKSVLILKAVTGRHMQLGELILTGDTQPCQVLAQGSQSEGSDVSQWTWGNTWCDWAEWVHQGHGASFQTTRSLRFQSTFSGRRLTSIALGLCPWTVLLAIVMPIHLILIFKFLNHFRSNVNAFASVYIKADLFIK